MVPRIGTVVGGHPDRSSRFRFGTPRLICLCSRLIKRFKHCRSLSFHGFFRFIGFIDWPLINSLKEERRTEDHFVTSDVAKWHAGFSSSWCIMNLEVLSSDAELDCADITFIRDCKKLHLPSNFHSSLHYME
ncbi:hypothetical protein HS088_TW04G00049 [Tripterygium wilfordii]|uniref:Uncharacterized protein n=1 Tax=Tripterygium wilfordii TaxID=458696 RepID=A0A7J7DP09_TRIWF|nr:hypothetical protein HS088_TW04G00049 [Tripterygium wilfordii]